MSRVWPHSPSGGFKCENAVDIEETDSVENLREAMKSQSLSCSTLVEALLDKAKFDPYNSFITVTEQLAQTQSREADVRLKTKRARPLEGIPLAVKDNFCTTGIRTTAASKMLENFVPDYESTVTKNLLNAGAVIIGKTNMDEFAMGSTTESSYFGPTLNPVARELGLSDMVPGGSSGGSAAAVAGGSAYASIGTDTGGSIRQPASFCGLVGYKPTYGACSRWGVIAYASSLDQPGVITKSVKDAAIIMDVIAGEDEKDSTSLTDSRFQFEKALATERAPIRVGIIREVAKQAQTEATKAVMSKLSSMCKAIGIEVVELSMPTFPYSLPAYYIIALSEASSNLARYDGVRYGYRSESPDDIIEMYESSRAEGFGAEVKKRIMLGTYSLSAGNYEQYYGRARKVREKLASEWSDVFREVDVVAMPTTPTSAFEIGKFEGSSLEMYLEDLFTVPVNLAGLPAISIPICNDTNGMPLGLQLIGRQLDDTKLMRIAATMEIAEAMVR